MGQAEVERRREGNGRRREGGKKGGREGGAEGEGIA